MLKSVVVSTVFGYLCCILNTFKALIRCISFVWIHFKQLEDMYVGNERFMKQY